MGSEGLICIHAEASSKGVGGAGWLLWTNVLFGRLGCNFCSCINVGRVYFHKKIKKIILLQ